MLNDEIEDSTKSMWNAECGMRNVECGMNFEILNFEILKFEILKS